MYKVPGSCKIATKDPIDAITYNIVTISLIKSSSRL